MSRIIKKWQILKQYKPQQKPGSYDLYYMVDCDYTIGDWIESQDKDLWVMYGSRHQSIYWVNEKLLTILIITWPDPDIVL